MGMTKKVRKELKLSIKRINFFKKNLIKSLITHHDEPKKHDKGSGRDTVLTYPENPLTFPSKMKSYGFTVKSEPYYHGFNGKIINIACFTIQI